jgi:hypothetical protein
MVNLQKFAKPGACGTVSDLGPSFTHLGLYRRFLYERGYVIIRSTASGRKRETTKRTDTAWGEKEPLPIMSLTTFMKYCRKEFPRLRNDDPSDSMVDDVDASPAVVAKVALPPLAEASIP